MKLTLFDPENWREIGATLARNKTRTFLTAFGIFWGTAMLAMLWGGAQGFEGIMRRNFAGLSTNLGGVFPNRRTMPYKGFNKGTPWNLTTGDVEKICSAAPAIENSSIIVNRWSTGSYGSRTTEGNIIGVEGEYTMIMNPVIEEGRFINDSDVAGARKVAVIGRNRATDLFGSESPVGKYVSINGIYVLCVGVASQLGQASIAGNIQDSFIMPCTTVQNVFNIGDKVDFFVFTAPSGHSPTENFPTIRRVTSASHAIHPDDKEAYFFMDVSETFAMFDKVFLGISLLALFIGAASLMAGVIGVGNIMWIVVKERTHEFGIRRAIGAKPYDITMQVLSESILLTLLAGTAGVCFAALVLGIVDNATAEPNLPLAGFELPFSTAVGIVIIFFILGSAAGTLPAVKAMRIKPIEAIRDK